MKMIYKWCSQKRKSAVHSASSLRHIILPVVCDMVKHVLQPVKLSAVQQTDGSDGNFLRSDTAVLAVLFRHAAVPVGMYTPQIVVHRLSLLFARVCRRTAVLNILRHVADRICQQRVVSFDNRNKFLQFHTPMSFGSFQSACGRLPLSVPPPTKPLRLSPSPAKPVFRRR